jgi:hypothetical protein
MHQEKTYLEVVHNYSLGNPIVTIQSKLLVLPSSGKLPVTILGQCHYTQVVETNQVTKHLID